MDILYIIGKGSRWGNNELRYSLRSVEKFASNVDEIYVVGNIPKFLDFSDPNFYSLAQPGLSKEHNIAWRIQWACENTDISDQFLFMNDDHIFVNPVDISTYPNYWNGNLTEALRSKSPGPYARAILETIRVLEPMDCPMIYYDVHTPIIYDKKLFSGMSEMWEKSSKVKFGFVVKSIYGNLAKVPLGPEIKDCKLTQYTFRNIKDIYRKVVGRDVISFNDEALQMGLSTYLKKHFPAPSSYE